MTTTPQMERASLFKRADYTHQFNASSGRHGWLRLTPAYSAKIAGELLGAADRSARILDPFCGTGTTALSAAYSGQCGVTTEVNPFLVWFSEAKLARYTPGDIARARSACAEALRTALEGKVAPAPLPAIHNVTRWWASDAQVFLQLLKSAIGAATEQGSPERTLLKVAFCRTLIALSNAAFNHQSMSFRADGGQMDLAIGRDFPSQFRGDVDFVLAGAGDNPSGSCAVIEGDARQMQTIVQGSFDLVVTSPPYVNRMSYIRELRPYLYWLDFISNGRDAGELDWASIGGTWGIATSRLQTWRASKDCFRSKRLGDLLLRIASGGNPNGGLLANYIAKYFEDVWWHLRGLRPVLSKGASIHYIVGNSTFYGVLLPVEELYAEMLRELGFENVGTRAIRKRNSRRELAEFDVSAAWPA